MTASRNAGINVGLISLDQQKAFDRVEHDYLWATFEAFLVLALLSQQWSGLFTVTLKVW